MDAGCTHRQGPWGPAVPLRPFPAAVHPAVCRKHCPALHSQETPSFTTQAAARRELGPSSRECGEPRPPGRRAPGTSLSPAQGPQGRGGRAWRGAPALGEAEGALQAGFEKAEAFRQSVTSIKSPSLVGGAQPRPWQGRGQGAWGGSARAKPLGPRSRSLAARGRCPCPCPPAQRPQEPTDPSAEPSLRAEKAKYAMARGTHPISATGRGYAQVYTFTVGSVLRADRRLLRVKMKHASGGILPAAGRAVLAELHPPQNREASKMESYVQKPCMTRKATPGGH